MLALSNQSRSAALSAPSPQPCCALLVFSCPRGATCPCALADPVLRRGLPTALLQPQATRPPPQLPQPCTPQAVPCTALAPEPPPPPAHAAEPHGDESLRGQAVAVQWWEGGEELPPGFSKPDAVPRWPHQPGCAGDLPWRRLTPCSVPFPVFNLLPKSRDDPRGDCEYARTRACGFSHPLPELRASCRFEAATALPFFS